MQMEECMRNLNPLQHPCTKAKGEPNSERTKRKEVGVIQAFVNLVQLILGLPLKPVRKRFEPLFTPNSLWITSQQFGVGVSQAARTEYCNLSHPSFWAERAPHLARLHADHEQSRLE